MAENSDKVRGSSWHWTNERHLHFLNSMEASFVQSMFQTNCLPLDRYLPDTSESTKDLGNQIKHRILESSGRNTEKKTTILSCQKSSQDQVVPQFPKKEE